MVSHARLLPAVTCRTLFHQAEIPEDHVGFEACGGGKGKFTVGLRYYGLINFELVATFFIGMNVLLWCMKRKDDGYINAGGNRSVKFYKFALSISSAIFASGVIFNSLDQLITFPAAIPVLVEQVISTFYLNRLAFYK